jgi:hypothetical protein
MFAPVVAEALRDKGYDVIAVVTEAGLRPTVSVPVSFV